VPAVSVTTAEEDDDDDDDDDDDENDTNLSSRNVIQEDPEESVAWRKVEAEGLTRLRSRLQTRATAAREARTATRVSIEIETPPSSPIDSLRSSFTDANKSVHGILGRCNDRTCLDCFSPSQDDLIGTFLTARRAAAFSRRASLPSLFSSEFSRQVESTRSIAAAAAAAAVVGDDQLPPRQGKYGDAAKLAERNESGFIRRLSRFGDPETVVRSAAAAARRVDDEYSANNTIDSDATFVKDPSLGTGTDTVRETYELNRTGFKTKIEMEHVTFSESKVGSGDPQYVDEWKCEEQEWLDEVDVPRTVANEAKLWALSMKVVSGEEDDWIPMEERRQDTDRNPTTSLPAFVCESPLAAVGFGTRELDDGADDWVAQCDSVEHQRSEGVQNVELEAASHIVPSTAIVLASQARIKNVDGVLKHESSEKEDFEYAKRLDDKTNRHLRGHLSDATTTHQASWETLNNEEEHNNDSHPGAWSVHSNGFGTDKSSPTSKFARHNTSPFLAETREIEVSLEIALTRQEKRRSVALTSITYGQTAEVEEALSNNGQNDPRDYSPSTSRSNSFHRSISHGRNAGSENSGWSQDSSNNGSCSGSASTLDNDDDDDGAAGGGKLHRDDVEEAMDDPPRLPSKPFVPVSSPRLEVLTCRGKHGFRRYDSHSTNLQCGHCNAFIPKGALFWGCKQCREIKCRHDCVRPPFTTVTAQHPKGDPPERGKDTPLQASKSSTTTRGENSPERVHNHKDSLSLTRSESEFMTRLREARKSAMLLRSRGGEAYDEEVNKELCVSEMEKQRQIRRQMRVNQKMWREENTGSDQEHIKAESSDGERENAYQEDDGGWFGRTGVVDSDNDEELWQDDFDDGGGGGGGDGGSGFSDLSESLTCSGETLCSDAEVMLREAYGDDCALDWEDEGIREAVHITLAETAAPTAITFAGHSRDHDHNHTDGNAVRRERVLLNPAGSPSSSAAPMATSTAKAAEKEKGAVTRFTKRQLETETEKRPNCFDELFGEEVEWDDLETRETVLAVSAADSEEVTRSKHEKTDKRWNELQFANTSNANEEDARAEAQGDENYGDAIPFFSV